MAPGTELPRSLAPLDVQHLPAPLHDAYLNAFAGSMHMVFLVAACVVLLAFALAWLMKDAPLRK